MASYDGSETCCASWGSSGEPPPAELAASDPAAFLERLTVASQSAELTRSGGLGDFWWVVSPAVGA